MAARLCVEAPAAGLLGTPASDATGGAEAARSRTPASRSQRPGACSERAPRRRLATTACCGVEGGGSMRALLVNWARREETRVASPSPALPSARTCRAGRVCAGRAAGVSGRVDSARDARGPLTP